MDWRYEPTGDFGQAPIERLKNFPRHPDMLVYAARSVANLMMRAALAIYNRLEVRGRENLPRSGSYIIVANHSSHFDAPALLAALPLAQIHRAFPAAASDYFFSNLGKVAFSAIVINAMPFDRTGNPLQSIALCRQLLETPDHILILFPEGTRSTDGSIGMFRPGVAFLAAGPDIPVVPCHIDGAFKAWPKGKMLPRPRKLRVTFGQPRKFERATSNSKEHAIGIANELHDAVVALRPV